MGDTPRRMENQKCHSAGELRSIGACVGGHRSPAARIGTGTNIRMPGLIVTWAVAEAP